MEGTCQISWAPMDCNETPGVPEWLDEIPIDIINMEVGPANGSDGIDVEQPEIVD